MRPEQLMRAYPRVFHMAWDGSWPNIREYGLLSAEALTSLYGIDGGAAVRLLREHRPHWVRIAKEGLPEAVLRDQKPMSDGGLRRALGANVELSRWYQLLNSMVFFWPTTKRLVTMMSARAYRNMRHDVIVVDTARLIERHMDSVRLCAMNSGATKPYPHSRSMESFMRIGDFPFDDRVAKYGVERAVGEVCVQEGVRDIEACTLEVRTVTLDEALTWA